MVRNQVQVDNPIARELLPSSTRREALLLLKKRGGLTAEQLGEALNITPVGARAHLTALEREGLVERVRQRQPVGRPVHVYRLTARAQELFPQNYQGLATEVLDDLETLFGRDALVQLFRRRADRLKAAYRDRLAGKSFDERVRELARLQDERGYLVDLRPQEDGSYLIVEQNCAIEGVARRFAIPCQAELSLFRDLFPDGEVTRENHLLAGDLHCAYRIARRRTGQ